MIKKDRSEYNRQWYRENREHKKKAMADLYQQDRERILARNKRWNKQHPDTMREANKRQAPERKRIYTKYATLKYAVKMHNGCLNPACLWSGPFEPSQLDLHHLDPKTKSFNIGAGSKTKRQLIREAKKCTVVCSNCHRLITWNLLDTSNFKPIDLTPWEDLI